MSEHSHQPDFEPSGFFALRTPFLPFDELLAWSDGLEAPVGRRRSSDGRKRLAADRSRLRDRLRAVLARPDVREALFVASPDLEERLDVLAAGARERGGPEDWSAHWCAISHAWPGGRRRSACSPAARSGRSVTRRAWSSRTAPLRAAHSPRHGLPRGPDGCAGCAIRPAELRWLSASIRASIAVNGRVCFAEVRRNGKGWTHHQVALEASDYLAATLARAGAGAAPAALATALVEDDPDASRPRSDARGIRRRIDQQSGADLGAAPGGDRTRTDPRSGDPAAGPDGLPRPAGSRGSPIRDWKPSTPADWVPSRRVTAKSPGCWKPSPARSISPGCSRWTWSSPLIAASSGAGRSRRNRPRGDAPAPAGPPAARRPPGPFPRSVRRPL